MEKFVAAIVALTLLAPICYAQSPARPGAFDVASVKLNRSGAPFRMGPVLQPGGRVVATNVVLRDLIRAAFNLDENQIVGATGWAATAQFDLEARGPADLMPAQAQAMLRQLLADRFQLATHAETRQLPIYRLVMARRDRALGPRLKPSGPECAPITPPAGVPLPPPPPPGSGGPSTSLTAMRGLSRRCGMMMYPGGMSARAMTLEALAGLMAFSLGRPVVNETGLDGDFDIDMTYAPDLGVGPSPTVIPATTAPSLFTALEEQLGLKLESARGPVDVVVIDRVERPADN
jgi:uncharacterized protein (TIGR03435 family)